MSVEQVGIAGGGVAVGAFLLKVGPIIIKKLIGNGTDNGKPGKAETCLEHDGAIASQGQTIDGICAMQADQKEQAETNRKENREDHINIREKLDKIMENTRG